ncbi:MAG: tRNA (N6-isopentenyl adenosine(37)-C2)-methylthiotransferase MiaB [Oscillibacter sp.]|nr:tRNA (N6-isopentenyl adenosine(37)-C2)-methylthiotransferase MiaB [Oscillibacter sp.]
MRRRPLDRTQVILPAGAVRRQEAYTGRLAALYRRKDRPPLAMVDTYGCQQNVADSQRIMGMLRDMGCGFTQDPYAADIIVINTCAIRENAEKKVFGVVGQLVHVKERNPEVVICLCGCMAQQETVADRIRKSYRHVDLVFGPQALWRFPELLYGVCTEGKRVFSIADEHGSIAEGLPVVRESGVKAWVSIMYGCNNFCSYCIVPYVRGRERSREAADILNEVRGLVEEGYKEITLLGQNVNSYGKDLDVPMDFADLLREIDRIPGNYLIRFMTSHPKDAGEKLFAAMAECPHVARQLHLPVQSGSSRVLKAMNRGYTREQYLEKVDMARRAMPDIVLTSDIIIGFPGETEAEAMETVSLIEQVRYDALFTFIYSPRPGTPAAKLPDPASRAEKQIWFDKLLDVQNRISAELHRGYVGKTVRVLVDGESGDEAWPLSSRTAGGRLVHLRGDAGLIGQYAEAKIVDSNTWALFGEIFSV